MNMKLNNINTQTKLNKINNIDCFELLKKINDDCIDLILTDPPYLISRETNFKKYKTRLKKYDISMNFGTWDYKFNDFKLLIKEFYRILKPGGTLIIFFDIWKITFLSEIMKKNKFNQLRIIEWIKTNPVPINAKINYLTNSREIAISGVKKSKPTFNSYYDNGIYEFPIEHIKGRIHPTQKSLKLFEKLIVKHSNKNDIVLDCFMGSGTTAIGCINKKRNFIGSENNKRFYNHSIKRIN